MSGRGRRSVNIAGMGHRAPIPMASRVGRMIYSSGIGGVDTSTGKVAPDAQQQTVHAFRNMKAVLQEAGGTLDDLIRITFFIQEERFRDYINEQWVEYFPNEHDRPSRHVLVHEHLRGGMLMQLEFVAECASDD